MREKEKDIVCVGEAGRVFRSAVHKPGTFRGIGKNCSMFWLGPIRSVRCVSRKQLFHKTVVHVGLQCVSSGCSFEADCQHYRF